MGKLNVAHSKKLHKGDDVISIKDLITMIIKNKNKNTNQMNINQNTRFKYKWLIQMINYRKMMSLND